MENLWAFITLCGIAASVYFLLLRKRQNFFIVGKRTKIWHPSRVNIYGCRIGEDCNIGDFVEIGPGVVIGNRVRIGAHTFIPEGVTIEDDCFIGPRVTFCNDRYPPSHRDKWEKIVVRRGAAIGAGAIILPGVIIGEGVLVGAGAVVTSSIPDKHKSYGHPSRHYEVVGDWATPDSYMGRRMKIIGMGNPATFSSTYPVGSKDVPMDKEIGK